MKNFYIQDVEYIRMLKETYFEMINFCLQMFDDIKIGVEGSVNKNE